MDQAEIEELLEEGIVFGRPRYRCHRGALMEQLWHDYAMPRVPLAPAPAWRSIDEPEPLLESELYDRRNGHGRFWGRAEPEICGTTLALPKQPAVLVMGLVLLFGILEKDSA